MRTFFWHQCLILMSDVALIDINTLQKCKIIKSVKRNNKILAKNVLQYLIMNMRKQIAKFELIYFLMFRHNAIGINYRSNNKR